jgi:hypothetical protein
MECRAHKGQDFSEEKSQSRWGHDARFLFPLVVPEARMRGGLQPPRPQLPVPAAPALLNQGGRNATIKKASRKGCEPNEKRYFLHRLLAHPFAGCLAPNSGWV